jgi:hypothetical protein
MNDLGTACDKVLECLQNLIQVHGATWAEKRQALEALAKSQDNSDLEEFLGWWDVELNE